MKVIIKVPLFFRILNIIGCFLMLFGLVELYSHFLPDTIWRPLPLVCIVVGVILIIPQHFVALMEILKYRPKNDN